MIRSISIKAFKSLLEVEVTLGRVNVFIGANGSGKSNLLEAIGVLGEEKVKEIEADYRAEVKQMRGHLAKKKCYEFIELLAKAVEVAQQAKESSDANEE